MSVDHSLLCPNSLRSTCVFALVCVQNENSLCDCQQVFGCVYLDFHVVVFQLHKMPPDVHLLSKCIDQLLPQLVHLSPALLRRVSLHLR